MKRCIKDSPYRVSEHRTRLRRRRLKTIRMKTMLSLICLSVVLTAIVFGMRYYFGKGLPESSEIFSPIRPPSFLYNIYEGKNKLKHPLAVAIEKSGKIYVSNNSLHTVEVLSQRGTGETSIGSSGEGPKNILFPYGIAFLPGGSLLVAETGNYRVQEFLPSGQFVRTVVGQPNSIGLVKPGPIQVDNKGNIYIGDLSGNQVIVIDSMNRVIRRIKNIMYPHGIAIDEKNRKLYISDSGESAVKVFSLDKNDNNPIKVINTTTPNTGFSMVRGLAVDKLGRLYVVETLISVIRVFDKNGEYLFSFGRSGSGDGEFVYPNCIAADSTGKVYVSDWGNNRVQVWGYTDSVQKGGGDH